MEVPSCCSWNRVSSTPLRSPLIVSLSLLSGSTSVYRQWMRKGGARRATSGAWCTRKETVLPTWRPSSSLSSTSSMSGHHSRTAWREARSFHPPPRRQHSRCRHLFPSSSSNPPIQPYGSGGLAALPQSIQQRISRQPFVYARFAHSFGLHATFLPATSRNRPSARADYARTRRLRPSVTSRDSSAKRSRFVGGLRALYPPRPA